MRASRSESWGAVAWNVLAVLGAVAVYLILWTWAASLESALWGPQVSGTLRIYALPLLLQCLAAALAGVGLGVLLRTGRPVVYAGLLAILLPLYQVLNTTVYHLEWWNAVWLALSVVLPALAAAAAALWLARRRGAGRPVLDGAS